MTMLRLILLIGLLSTGAWAQTPNPSTAQGAFDTLKALVGDWRMPTKRGPIQLNFKLVARGSVLVETFVTPSGKTSLTLYHLDNQALIATHYCPQGNQPRLRWTPKASGLHFSFRDATNLKDGASHLHDMVIEHAGATLKKIETYHTAGKPDVSTLTFARVPATR
jgi:hypothetical protein